MSTPTAETKTSALNKPLKSILKAGFDASIQSKQPQSGACFTTEQSPQQDEVSGAVIASSIIAQQQSAKVTPPPNRRSIIAARHLPLCNPASHNGKRLKQPCDKKTEEPSMEDWDDASVCSEALAKVLWYAVDPVRILSDLHQNCEAFVIHVRCNIDECAGGTGPLSSEVLPAITVAGNLKHLDSVVDAISQRPDDYGQTWQDPQTPTRAFIVIELRYPGVDGGKAGVAVSQDRAHLGFVSGLLKQALEEKKDPAKEPSVELALLDSPKKVGEFLQAKRAI